MPRANGIGAAPDGLIKRALFAAADGVSDSFLDGLAGIVRVAIVAKRLRDVPHAFAFLRVAFGLALSFGLFLRLPRLTDLRRLAPHDLFDAVDADEDICARMLLCPLR